MELKRQYLPETKMVEQLVSCIFNLCIKGRNEYNEIWKCRHRINICFQERTDYKMYFAFEIDRSKKIITVTSCTFDDDIQQILKKCNIK